MVEDDFKKFMEIYKKLSDSRKNKVLSFARSLVEKADIQQN